MMREALLIGGRTFVHGLVGWTTLLPFGAVVVAPLSVALAEPIQGPVELLAVGARQAIEIFFRSTRTPDREGTRRAFDLTP
jgi:hypothetical protein